MDSVYSIAVIIFMVQLMNEIFGRVAKKIFKNPDFVFLRDFSNNPEIIKCMISVLIFVVSYYKDVFLKIWRK